MSGGGTEQVVDSDDVLDWEHSEPVQLLQESRRFKRSFRGLRSGKNRLVLVSLRLKTDGTTAAGGLTCGVALVSKFTDDCTVCSIVNMRLILRSLGGSISPSPDGDTISSTEI